ncbi:MAG: hypothetical protein QM722_05230 [Piscinibacter sp.]
MTTLDHDLLSRVKTPEDGLADLRSDLQDSLKEYADLDLLIELLQNAIDAVEEQRYRAVCIAAGLKPSDADTAKKWNTAVDQVLETDYAAYVGCADLLDKAQFYKNCTNTPKRRDAWWVALADQFECKPEDLSSTAAGLTPQLTVTINVGGPIWIEVEDNDPGMADVVASFRHKQSQKRPSASTLRRYGLRGSHGWGLSAVLAMSNTVEVVSRTAEGVQAYVFRDYASFTKETVTAPTNERIDLESAAAANLSERLRKNAMETGTHIRVQIASDGPEQLMTHTLSNYSHEKLINLLRLYTPVGQVNDFLLHPAFHTYRSDDITLLLRGIGAGKDETKKIPFGLFRISECTAIASQTFDAYVASGMPRNHSVHTIHRAKKGGTVYLSGAEIQPADPVFQAVEDYHANSLPSYIDDNGKMVATIPRGFNLALSGGMRAELLVRPPRSTSAAFRGFVLVENLRPTLGRKHVMDQRQAPAKVAAEHERDYDEIRRKLLPTAVPPVASPAAAKWRREFFERVIADLKTQVPLSGDLYCYAGSESLEARVMLIFAELLQKTVFGDLRVLRAHLQDRYDFAFLYHGVAGSAGDPTMTMSSQLSAGGWIELNGSAFLRYGIGEFKAHGDDVFDDFDVKEPRKAPDTIDLLVCWNFDEERVAEENWTSDVVADSTREFAGQTHTWTATSTSQYPRQRQLAVVSLSTLLDQSVAATKLNAAPAPWALPGSYY